MKAPRSSNALALAVGLLALAIATTGSAMAATGQLVNIADGKNAGQLAKVDALGRLLVGDGSGPLTIDVEREPWLVTLSSTSGTAAVCVGIPVPTNRRVVVTGMSGGGVVGAQVQVQVPGLAGPTGLLAAAGFKLTNGSGPSQPAFSVYELSQDLDIIIPSTATSAAGARTLSAPKACLTPLTSGRAEAVVSGYYARTR